MLHVGFCDDLAEDIAEQPDVPSHRLRQLGRLTFPVHAHGAHNGSVTIRHIDPIAGGLPCPS